MAGTEQNGTRIAAANGKQDNPRRREPDGRTRGDPASLGGGGASYFSLSRLFGIKRRRRRKCKRSWPGVYTIVGSSIRWQLALTDGLYWLWEYKSLTRYYINMDEWMKPGNQQQQQIITQNRQKKRKKKRLLMLCLVLVDISIDLIKIIIAVVGWGGNIKSFIFLLFVFDFPPPIFLI